MVGKEERAAWLQFYSAALAARYVERYGDIPPTDLLPETWQEIREWAGKFADSAVAALSFEK